MEKHSIEIVWNDIDDVRASVVEFIGGIDTELYETHAVEETWPIRERIEVFDGGFPVARQCRALPILTILGIDDDGWAVKDG